MPDTMAVTRGWRYEGYEGGIEDSLILIDGRQIGGAYHCQDETWASYGPCGYSFKHATREDAEAVQADMYVTNPDLYDRLNADHQAKMAAELAEREAEFEARCAAREEAERRARLGDDEPGVTVWTLPAYHVLYADLEEIDAVSTWFTANGVRDVDALQEVRVEQRADRMAIVWEVPTSKVRGLSGSLTHVVTLATDPPVIATLDRPELHAVLGEHWPARFPLIDFGQRMACGACTHAATKGDMVLWPCPIVENAIRIGP